MAVACFQGWPCPSARLSHWVGRSRSTHLRAWLARFAGRDDVAFALEGCTGWRYVAEELGGAGVAAHVAEPADTAFARGRKRHAKAEQGHPVRAPGPPLLFLGA